MAADLEAVIAASLKGSDSGSGDSGTPASDPSTDSDLADETSTDDAGVEMASGAGTDPVVSGDPPAVEASGTPAETPAPVEGETAKSAEVATDDDPFAKELGLKPRADGKENRIPYSRVKVIVENKVKAAEKAVLAHWEPQIKERDTKITDYEGRLDEIGKVEAIMFDEPEKFVSMLPSINPRYAEFLQGGSSAAAAEPKAPAVPADMPMPDYDLGNGQKTYGPEGLSKLLAWQAASVAKQVREDLAKEYKPIKDSYESQQLTEAAMPRLRAVMAEAMKWEGFEENRDAILEELRQDRVQAERTKTQPKLNLESAYQKVWWPKQKAKYEAELAAAKTDAAKVREKILAELKNAPSATSAAAANNKPPAPAANTDDLEEVIRGSIKSVRV